MVEQARIANHITRVILRGGDNDNAPMNRAIAHLGFLSPADFMICTKDDLNSVGSIPITRAQKNRIMHLRNFWVAQPVESRDWMRVTPEMYESWLANPVATPSRAFNDKRHFEEATPGSKANPSSRAALLSLVEIMEETKFTVVWCGGVGNLQSRIQDSQVSTQDFSALLRKRLGISMEEIAGGGLDELNFLNLRTESETAFQQVHLRDNFFNVESAKALDLSNATANGPFFKPATKVDGDHSVSAKAGNPDGTSVVAPMDLEIKSDSVDSDKLAKIDYEVLKQAVERVSMRMRNQGFLKMAFAFAVTGRSAWFLFVQRAEPLDKPTLWADRVPHRDVGNMWISITQLAGHRPGFFLSDDGAAICNAMNKIGVTTWCCRVKALAQSQSIVYGVTVPKVYKSGGTPLIGIDVEPSSITYAVKIIRDGATFKTESEALQKIAAEAGLNSNFYALGCVPRNGEATRFSTISEWETGIRYKPTGRFWWDRFDTVEREGGAIIMRRGIVTASRCFRADDALPKQVCSDLVNSLQLAHSAGILQCDLRRRNFVQLSDSWQVIDYSLSAEVNSQANYKLEAGAQAEYAGNNVKALYKKKAPIQWTKVDDYQMLIANIMSS